MKCPVGDLEVGLGGCLNIWKFMAKEEITRGTITLKLINTRKTDPESLPSLRGVIQKKNLSYQVMSIYIIIETMGMDEILH